MRKILTLLLLVASIAGNAADLERHVVLVVWDGMRPDFVNVTNTPALYALANRGVFFAHNHPAYVSSTEVNGTELATGDYPQRSWVIGNREFRPEINPLEAFSTESIEAMRKADQRGGYLGAPTLAEILQRQGYHTTIAGTKPVVLLQDHAERPADAPNVVLYEGHALPTNALPRLIHALGPFRDQGETKTNRDLWTTRSLTELFWSNNVPAFTVLWLAEPDNTQHATGLGSAQSLAAIRSSDDALAHVVAHLKVEGVYDTADIIVVSDHGFSTISTNINMVARLRRAGFRAFRQFDAPPAKGDVLLVGLGGSALLYVNEHDEKTIDGVIRFLQTDDAVGTIFSLHAHPGTFPLDAAMIHSPEAPDIVVSFRWTADRNENGAPGFIISESQGSNLTAITQKATHASLSPFDMHNILVAAGPDFREGYVDETPSGNVDVAPTILKILGVKSPQAMDGRVLSEALNSSDAKLPKVETKELHARATLPTGEWMQTLKISEVNGVRYLDEGTGQFIPKTSTKP
ncbi:MAG TPA: alkaline phosphatase family protein [Verrucomicrobiae bacterium]|nr:alkaline phosphatase family protein [Verrucomicrobiae bacterium]